MLSLLCNFVHACFAGTAHAAVTTDNTHMGQLQQDVRAHTPGSATGEPSAFQRMQALLGVSMCVHHIWTSTLSM
jgi:hypothetical protein